MVMRNSNVTSGIKGTTQIDNKYNKVKPKRYTTEPQERVDICLSCKKPARECKGQCFGGV